MKISSKENFPFVSEPGKEETKFTILNQKAWHNKVNQHVQKEIFNTCDCDGYGCTVDTGDSCISD